jgi:hypothetical protein
VIRQFGESLARKIGGDGDILERGGEFIADLLVQGGVHFLGDDHGQSIAAVTPPMQAGGFAGGFAREFENCEELETAPKVGRVAPRAPRMKREYPKWQAGAE